MKTDTVLGIIKKALLFGAIAAVVVCQTGSAWSATTNNYVFSRSQNPGFPNQEMARLSIFGSGADTVWTLSANWDNQYNAGSPFVFSLNYKMPTGKISQSTLPLFDVAGDIRVKSFGRKGIKFQPSNTSLRFTDGESASWTFLNTTPLQFTDFELHINSIYNGRSVKFTPCSLPEPSTYDLFALGALVSLVAYRRIKT